MTPQEFVQRASVAAWNDEAHVEEKRARLRAEAEGVPRPVRVATASGSRGASATFYLWVAVPGGMASLDWAMRLLDGADVIVAPGSFFGPEGEGYVRMAMVPTMEECERAAGALDGVLGGRACVSVHRAGRADRAARGRSRISSTPTPWRRRSGMLDRGEARVAEPDGDGWAVNEWAKKAVLLYFRVRDLETTEVGPFEYHDQLPLKRGYEEAGVRVVPPATARYGAFLSRGVVLMPSYVNIGAWIGPGTLVDTWATVGSCAQIGADVHLSGGVGIGGVLEPIQASPVIVEDGAFVGSRCIVVEGVRVRARAVLGAGLILTGNTPVIDVTGEEPVEHRGEVPAGAIVVPGSRPREFPAGEYGLPVRPDHRVPRSEATDSKLQLNEMLREFGSSVGS